MIVRFKKLDSSAVVPSKAHSSDAGFDLVAVDRERGSDGSLVYHTGIAVEIPEGYVGLVFPRSSIARKDLSLCNSVGVIDSGYRGEITFKFKLSRRAYFEGATHPRDFYEVGERIGQLIILPYPSIEFEEADSLSETDRGEGGYGSTGR